MSSLLQHRFYFTIWLSSRIMLYATQNNLCVWAHIACSHFWTWSMPHFSKPLHWPTIHEFTLLLSHTHEHIHTIKSVTSIEVEKLLDWSHVKHMIYSIISHVFYMWSVQWWGTSWLQWNLDDCQFLFFFGVCASVRGALEWDLDHGEMCYYQVGFIIVEPIAQIL